LYIFTHYNLCVILNILCFAAHEVTLRSTAMQQTGTVLHGKKFTHNSVSSLWSLDKQCHDVIRTM